MKIIYKIFCCIYLLMTMSAFAGLQVSPLSITLHPENQHAQEITLYNTGKVTILVQLEAQEIEYKNCNVNDTVILFSSNEFDNNIIFSEQSLVLSPGATKTIQISVKNVAVAEEKYYEIVVHSFAHSELFSNVQKFNNCPVTYKVKVISSPQLIKRQLEKKLQNKLLTIQNFGNVAEHISDIIFCEQDNKCHAIQSFILLPGAMAEYPISEEEELNFVAQSYLFEHEHKVSAIK